MQLGFLQHRELVCCKNENDYRKQIIVTHLKSGMSTPQISKLLNKDHRIVKKAADPLQTKTKQRERI